FKVGRQRSLSPYQELVENLPDIAALVEPPLIVRRVLREQIGVLHRRLLAVVSGNELSAFGGKADIA
ncbi:MAG: hypothetical protein WA725_02515, partial [Pseudolabrys sp.]